MYIWNKGSITGPSWKMPFFGPFLESMNPRFDQYNAKWNSAELSCVSVFHKYACETDFTIGAMADTGIPDLLS